MKIALVVLGVFLIGGFLCGCVDETPTPIEVVEVIEVIEVIEVVEVVEVIEEVDEVIELYYLDEVLGYDTSLYKNTEGEDVTVEDFVEIADYISNPTSLISEAIEDPEFWDILDEVGEIETLEDLDNFMSW